MKLLLRTLHFILFRYNNCIINMTEVLKKCNVAIVINYPHYLVPGHNLNSEILEEDEGGSVGFSYTCEHPLPFLPPAATSEIVLKGEDTAMELVKKKRLWNSRIRMYKNLFKNAKRTKEFCGTLQNIISSPKGLGYMSYQEASFVQLVTENPDEEFEGAYNWYYTGGCLDQMTVGNKVMLLTTDGAKGDKLCAVPLFYKSKWKASLRNAQTSNPRVGDRIYQLCSISKNEEGFVGVRLRYECHVYSLDSSLQLKHVHKATSKSPFVGVDVNSKKYCTITTKRYVQLWDINSSKHFAHGSIINNKSLADKWCSISYTNEPNNIMMTDRCCTHMLDERINLQNSSLVLCPKEVPHLLEDCEDISLLVQSCLLPNAFYMCTSHQVLLYDIRARSEPLQRWTHMMCSTPLHGSVLSPSSGEEVLCVGNQEPGEIVAIQNTLCGSVPYSEVPPFSIPNLNDAVDSAHKHGLWLDPLTQKRVRLSVIGLTWLPPHASELTFLSKTSAGDVFSHVLHKLQSSRVKMFDAKLKLEDMNVNAELVKDYSEEEDLKHLADWEKKVRKGKQSGVLKATRIRNMSRTYKGLLSRKKEIYQIPIKKRSKRDKWMISKKKLHQFVDVLAPRILTIWNIEDEPEWNYDTDSSFDEDDAPTSYDKVKEWLKSSQKDDTPHNLALESEIAITTPDESIIKLEMKNESEYPYEATTPSSTLQGNVDKYRESLSTSFAFSSQARYFETRDNNVTPTRINGHQNRTSTNEKCAIIGETVNLKKRKLDRMYKTYVAGF
ncbi:uncharacterized protein TAF1C-like isoform X2 [Periplaneta americana]|uniref:uncharacterized protein TAF1C-like isoform X2 n=1 Tax=Periplaneta americana TaxID=6978 RepID=UPI0037E7631C